jgi:large subunit ribosomal protein L2
LRSLNGRDNLGHITVYHRGGNVKKFYRLLDFFRNLNNIMGYVLNIEYDPNRTGLVALVFYLNGFFGYILTSFKLKEGDFIYNGNFGALNLSNSKSLYLYPVGSELYNLELVFGFKAKITRSAGTYSKIMKKMGNLIFIRLPSRELRLFYGKC